MAVRLASNRRVFQVLSTSMSPALDLTDVGFFPAPHQPQSPLRPLHKIPVNCTFPRPYGVLPRPQWHVFQELSITKTAVQPDKAGILL
jgi:hypothetical protein